jgi:hypothetical protein
MSDTRDSSQEQVLRAVEAVNSIALFAAVHESGTGSETFGVSPEVIRYCNHLASMVDSVILITKQDDSRVSQGSLRDNVCVVRLSVWTSECSMWLDVLQWLHRSSSLCSRLVLASDRCLLIHSLEIALRAWPRWRKLGEFWALTESFEERRHLQAHFVVFDSMRAVSALLDFARVESTDANLMSFELRLTRHFAALGIHGRAAYTTPALATITSSLSTNDDAFLVRQDTAACHWDRLLLIGCPLILRKRFRIPLAPDDLSEAFIREVSGTTLNPREFDHDLVCKVTF